MIKKVLLAVTLLALLLPLACDSAGAQNKPSSTGSEILKAVDLADQWKMNQMRLVIDSGEDLQLLLKLASGDQADGYFYLEKGSNVNFNITGNTLLYTSKASETFGQINSDRFAFTASQSQGTTYTLSFRNNTDSQITAFLELIYPSTGSMYVPVSNE